jgi:hypothetical protein
LIKELVKVAAGFAAGAFSVPVDDGSGGGAEPSSADMMLGWLLAAQQVLSRKEVSHNH